MLERMGKMIVGGTNVLGMIYIRFYMMPRCQVQY